MARTAPVESSDFMNPEVAGVIDFSNTPTGGFAVTPIAAGDREFDTTKEGMLAYEKFMAEPVTIVIHQTGDKNAPIVAEVALNGVTLVLPRERPVRIPRAFVEVLAQSQTRSYKQERDPNPMADEGMKTRRFIGSDYRFAVRHDPNPKGRAWLDRIIRQSA